MDENEFAQYICSSEFEQRVKILRQGLDWLEILHKRIVTGLEKDAERIKDDFEEITGYGWILSESSNKVTFRTEGFYILCYKPGLRQGTGTIYGTQIQIQGSAFAQGIDVEETLDTIESILFGEVLTNERQIGRTDFAVDCWVKEIKDITINGQTQKRIDNQYDSECIFAGLNRFGNALKTAKRDFDTRLGKATITVKLIGGKETPTFYLGDRTRLMMRIYRKDVEYEGNTKRLIERTWRDKGFDSTGIVIRVEFEIKRKWLREFVSPDEKNGKGISYNWFKSNYASIFTKCLDSVKHKPGKENGESVLWRHIRARLRECETIGRQRLEPDLNRVRHDFRISIWRAIELLGKTESKELFEMCLQVSDIPHLERIRKKWLRSFQWKDYHRKRKLEDEQKGYERENQGQRRLI